MLPRRMGGKYLVAISGSVRSSKMSIGVGCSRLCYSASFARKKKRTYSSTVRAGDLISGRTAGNRRVVLP